MKIDKDVILAIAIGILIGGLAAFFVFFLPKFLPKPPSKTEKKEVVQEEKKPSPSPTLFSQLSVEAPQDEAIFSEKKITVSGKANPGSLITVVSPVDESVIDVNDKGEFETTISLEEGANEISITAYKDGQEETKLITVYYTKEEI